MRALLVDLGHVLIMHSWEKLGEILLRYAKNSNGLAPLEFVKPLRQSHRLIDEHDLGHITPFEFYTIVMKLLRIEPGALPYRQFREIYAGDILSLNEPMVKLLRDIPLQPKIIASNISEVGWCGLRKKYGELFDELFCDAVLSFAIRSRKPEMEFFLECSRRLGQPPENLYFIDDRGVNIMAARRLGIRAFEYNHQKHERAEKKIWRLLYPEGY